MHSDSFEGHFRMPHLLCTNKVSGLNCYFYTRLIIYSICFQCFHRNFQIIYFKPSFNKKKTPHNLEFGIRLSISCLLCFSGNFHVWVISDVNPCKLASCFSVCSTGLCSCPSVCLCAYVNTVYLLTVMLFSSRTPVKAHGQWRSSCRATGRKSGSPLMMRFRLGKVRLQFFSNREYCLKERLN